MNAVIKTISRAAVAVAAAVAAHGAMAANATVKLDAASLVTNDVTATALGSASYASGTGILTTPISSQTASFVDFGNSDGFKLAFDVFGLPQTVSFSNFGYNVTTKTLTGNLVGTGVLASKIDYTNGDLLIAGTVSTVNNVLTASNFTLSSSLSTYLTSKSINPTQLSAALGVLQSVSIPVAAVPEPSTYALMGLGLVGISLIARQKRQA